jgi:hypothetical protein
MRLPRRYARLFSSTVRNYTHPYFKAVNLTPSSYSMNLCGYDYSDDYKNECRNIFDGAHSSGILLLVSTRFTIVTLHEL